jgi:predicted nucleic acid-binding protein
MRNCRRNAVRSQAAPADPAYDAYYLQCCIENRLPLLSLDARMCEVAKRLRIQIVE